MKSIFRYPGGKSSLRARIMSLAPAHFAEYREPFVGGGWVFFGIPKGKRRWINDKDVALMAVYRALRDDPVRFIRACQEIKPLEAGEGNERLKAVFGQFAKDGNMDLALRYYFLHRITFGGLPSRIRYGAVHPSNPEGWNIVAEDRLWQAAGLLCNVNITADDYLPLLRAPGDDAWIYCDPPYYVNNRLGKHSQVYAHVFSEEQHVLFAEHVRACPHKVLVTYDGEEPFIRGLYSDSRFRLHTEDVVYVLRSGEKRNAKELLITNYDPPQGEDRIARNAAAGAGHLLSLTACG
jgi:DNA adenine methylase